MCPAGMFQMQKQLLLYFMAVHHAGGECQLRQRICIALYGFDGFLFFERIRAGAAGHTAACLSGHRKPDLANSV